MGGQCKKLRGDGGHAVAKKTEESAGLSISRRSVNKGSRSK